MLRPMKTCLGVLLIGILPLVHGQETGTVIAPKIDSVAMFKNGLTVVHASFEVAAPGDHVWVDPPNAVHGAFFVEGAPGMVIRSTTRLMAPEGPLLPSGNLQRDLDGAMVAVGMLGEGGKLAQMIRGKVWTPPTPDRADWNTNYATTGGDRYGSYYSSRLLTGNPGLAGSAMPGGWLVVEVGGKRMFLPTGRIGQLEIENEAGARVEVPRPVMVFSAPKAGKVQLTYLTKGMAWMPAYQVDLLAADRVRLRQSAVVRNELMDLDTARLELISGYPNIKFSHVDSPMNPQANLAAFFQQISGEGGRSTGAIGQQIAFNSISNLASGSVMQLPQPDAGAPAEDLHYENIGVHALQEGDSLSLEVATAEANCERIVVWKVSDYRDEHGRMQRRRTRSEEDDPWDAVLFANPLKFPMTTAAVSVLEGGRFRGQSMATWTAPGQKASIKINKALTVRGEHSEIEEEGKREMVWIAGDDFQRTNVRGTLKVSNARADAVKMVIRTHFSGELLTAEGDPEKSLRADGVRSVNPHRQIEWMIDLGGGESKTLTYRYSVLVNR